MKHKNHPPPSPHRKLGCTLQLQAACDASSLVSHHHHHPGAHHHLHGGHHHLHPGAGLHQSGQPGRAGLSIDLQTVQHSPENDQIKWLKSGSTKRG